MRSLLAGFVLLLISYSFGVALFGVHLHMIVKG